MPIEPEKDDGKATSDKQGQPAKTPDVAHSGGSLPPEIGGQKGPEPTRYGDWEKNGRCTDF